MVRSVEGQNPQVLSQPRPVGPTNGLTLNQGRMRSPVFASSAVRVGKYDDLIGPIVLVLLVL